MTKIGSRSFLNHLFIAVVLSCFGLLPAFVQAQTASPETRSGQTLVLPSTPKEMLKTASELNGLESEMPKPWHIKLTYEEFDMEGDNVRDGSYEEFYFSPKKYKRIYSSDNFHQTEIATDAGLYHVGDQQWPGLTQYRVRNAVVSPFYAFHAERPNWRLDQEKTKFTSGELPCLSLHSTGNLIILPAPTACFQPDSVMLRFMRAGFTEGMSYNSIVQFQGRYVAREIMENSNGKPTLKIHVDELGEITHVDDAFFQVPEGARRLEGRNQAPVDYMDEYGVEKPRPQVPSGTYGHVTAKIVVGRDGGVIEASASEGPKKLREAVLKALRNYRFRPYYVLDQPVEVELQFAYDYNAR